LKLLGKMNYERIRFDIPQVERSHHDAESDYLNHARV